MVITCPICYESLEKTDHLDAEIEELIVIGGGHANFGGSDTMATPCGHLFHSACLLPWLNGGTVGTRDCPNCRRIIHKHCCIPLFLETSENNTPNPRLEQERMKAKAEYDNLAQENLDLREKITSVNEEVDDLKREIESVRNSNALLTEEKELAEAKFRSLQEMQATSSRFGKLFIN